MEPEDVARCALAARVLFSDYALEPCAADIDILLYDTFERSYEGLPAGNNTRLAVYWTTWYLTSVPLYCRQQWRLSCVNNAGNILSSLPSEWQETIWKLRKPMRAPQ